MVAGCDTKSRHKRQRHSSQEILFRDDTVTCKVCPGRSESPSRKPGTLLCPYHPQVAIKFAWYRFRECPPHSGSVRVQNPNRMFSLKLLIIKLLRPYLWNVCDAREIGVDAKGAGICDQPSGWDHYSLGWASGDHRYFSACARSSGVICCQSSLRFCSAHSLLGSAASADDII